MAFKTISLCLTLLLGGIVWANAQTRRAAAPAPKPTPAPTARPVQIFGPSQNSHVTEPPAMNVKTAPVGQPRRPRPLVFNALLQANHSVTALNGSRVSFNQLLPDDRATVVMFWATYCHVCHSAFEDWQAIYDSYARQGLNVIALNIQDPSEGDEVRRFLRERRLTFPVYFAPRALHSQLTEGRLGTPMTYVFDREGQLAARLGGWSRGRGKNELENVLRHVLAD